MQGVMRSEFRVIRQSLNVGLVKTVVDEFTEWNGCRPAGVVVHQSEAGKMAEILRDLCLALPVRTSGGCLVGEVWLQLPECAPCPTS
jgi:hypothetical protein